MSLNLYLDTSYVTAFSKKVIWLALNKEEKIIEIKYCEITSVWWTMVSLSYWTSGFRVSTLLLQWESDKRLKSLSKHGMKHIC